MGEKIYKSVLALVIFFIAYELLYQLDDETFALIVAAPFLILCGVLWARGYLELLIWIKTGE